MDNGIYMALSRQIAVFKNLENTANNVANINTPGFKASQMTFSSFLVEEVPQKDTMKFATIEDTYITPAEGRLETTGRMLDMAINGDGFFVVESPLGQRYTRAGHFQINQDGQLVTPQGYPVLNANASPITFEETDQDIVIGQSGSISVNGEQRDSLQIVSFSSLQVLERVNDQLYKTEASPVAVDIPKVAQGVLESSNVSGPGEVTKLVELTRSVSSTAKLIEVMYDLQRQTTDAWTRQS